jgi:hypothetical protein
VLDAATSRREPCNRSRWQLMQIETRSRDSAEHERFVT